MSGAFASEPVISARRAKTGFPGVHLFKFEDALRWAYMKSMWPLGFGLACCALEMMAAQVIRYDWPSSSMEFLHPSPRDADLMIVSGRLTSKTAPVARRLYDQMDDPKLVIAMGNCACSGESITKNCLSLEFNKIIPVDVFVSGCPPRSEDLLHCILTLYKENTK